MKKEPDYSNGRISLSERNLEELKVLGLVTGGRNQNIHLYIFLWSIDSRKHLFKYLILVLKSYVRMYLFKGKENENSRLSNHN